MSQASRDSLAQLQNTLEPTLAQGGLETAEHLFGALKVIDDNGALRRSITDPTLEPARREQLVTKVFDQHVSNEALTVLKQMSGARWSDERDFGDAVEKVGARTVAIVAERNGLSGLQQLTDELLGFTHTVESSHEVQRALTDAQAPVKARTDLAEKLLASGASPEARVLVRQAVSEPRGAKPADLVRRFADEIATRQSRWIADVTVARPLQQSQQDRLNKALSASFGRELTLNVDVDPQLVGGIRIQVGDEVLDSSIAGRLNDLNTKLAG